MEKLQFFDSRSQEKTIKWSQCSGDLIPMGIADMDIKIAESITARLEKIAACGDLGYNLTPNYPATVLNWMKRRHDWEINPDHVVYVSGMMSGITAVINLLTAESDPVVVLSPGYNNFHMLVEGNGRVVCESLMIYENLRYNIDWSDLESKLSGAKLMILSNPHNPMGRVWTKEELHHICTLCKKYGTYLLSDEIHADLTTPPLRHCPVLRDNMDYADHIITATSPSKCFNMAALFVANYVISNDKLRARFRALLEAHTNIFSVGAMEAAYDESEGWLDAAVQYLAGNAVKLREFLAQNTPKIKLAPVEASFLAWLDCSELGLNQEQLLSFFRRDAKLHVNDGTSCRLGGNGFVRMNFASSPKVFDEVLSRLKGAYERKFK